MKGACLETFLGFFFGDAKALRLVASGKVISGTLVSSRCQGQVS